VRILQSILLGFKFIILYFYTVFTPLKIILVDDDQDDHLIFGKALNELAIKTELISLPNGEKLMEHLSKNIRQLPDAIFLDLNMPRKNGAECLTEIKQNRKLYYIPVIIYSTDFHTDILDLLYKHGAFYCIRKSSNEATTDKNLKTVLRSILDHPGIRPVREKFAIGFSEAKSVG
jgi:CheY-like chemotaxis protein